LYGLWCIGSSADLWTGQPIRCDGAKLEYGQARADLQKRGGLCAGFSCHSRPRWS
jgi:hypothetical protein